MKNRIVSREEWLSERLNLLEKEKAFNRYADTLTKERSELPWVEVNQSYVFDTEEGQCSLGDLFEEKSQLIVYHFMFGEDWKEGCPSCSFLAETFDGMLAHLKQRDIQLVAISRTSLNNIMAYKSRMGWKFPWFSSLKSTFNFDYHVSFKTEEPLDSDSYNYAKRDFKHKEAPGVSVFVKGDDGKVYHTYSSYARGLDSLIASYRYIDLTSKGRNEEGLAYPMAWVKRHDQY